MRIGSRKTAIQPNSNIYQTFTTKLENNIHELVSFYIVLFVFTFEPSLACLLFLLFQCLLK